VLSQQGPDAQCRRAHVASGVTVAQSTSERATSRAAGKVPLLPYQLEISRAIGGSIRAHPIAGEAFRR
jgi:hypothetical protein